MGRLFQPTELQFDNSFMYQPPWELAKQALEYNEAGIEQTLQAASLFDNIDVKYIPDPVEQAIVEKEIKNYSDKANEYSTNMQLQLQNSPQSWKKYMPQLQSLGADLAKNMKTGNLSKIQQSAASFEKWQEDNKKIKEENPELYNIGMNYFINQWRKNPNRSLDSTFSGDQLINFDVTSKKFTEGLKDFKESLQQSQNGMYLVNNEWVDSRKVEQAYFDLVMADPNAAPFLRQMAKFGVPGYYDPETGGIVNPYTYVDSQGKEVSQEKFSEELEKWENIDPRYRNTVRKPSREFNPRFAWTGAFKAMGAKEGYSKVTLEQDKVKEAAASRSHSWAMQKDSQAHAFALENLRHKNDLERIREEALSKPDGTGTDKYAESVLQELGISLPALLNKNIDYSNTIAGLKDKKSANYQNWLNAASSKKALATMGIEKGENGMSFGKDVKTKMELVKLLNAQNVKGLYGERAVDAAMKEAVKKGIVKESTYAVSTNSYKDNSINPNIYFSFGTSGGGALAYSTKHNRIDNPFKKMMMNYETAKENYFKEDLNKYDSELNTYTANSRGAAVATAFLNDSRGKDVLKFVDRNGEELPSKLDYTFTYSSTIPGFSEEADFGDIALSIKAKDKDGKEVDAFAIPRVPYALDLMMDERLYATELQNKIREERSNYGYHLFDNTIRKNLAGTDEWTDINYISPGPDDESDYLVKLQARKPKDSMYEEYRIPELTKETFYNKKKAYDFIENYIKMQYLKNKNH